MKKIRVVIVDDSVLIRKMFTEILNNDPDIEVIDVAENAQDAREKIKALNPDVITLDIEMPGMDGLSFLEKIMSLRPMPVVMVSSLTQKGAEQTIKALELGAVDYLPKSTSKSFDQELADELVIKVKNAARAKVSDNSGWGVYGKGRIVGGGAKNYKKNILIAIGSSTGGVEALREVITVMPENAPPIVVVQHMPEMFTKTFSKRLNTLSHVEVHEASDNEEISAGNVYIAPGHSHLKISKLGGRYLCRLSDSERVSGHKPSVDVLFDSVATNVGVDSIGVILTGMGKDGAKGMLNMKKSGSFNIGQDESSSVVYGMPKAAYLAGAVDIQLPLSKIADNILKKSLA